MSTNILHPSATESSDHAIVSYNLPERRRVRIRVVPANRWAMILRTIVNWEERDAGDHQETWDGYDSSGNLLNLRKCSIIMETERIPSKAELRKLREAKERPVTLRGHFHVLHDPERCHELGVMFKTALTGQPLSGKISVMAEVDEAKRGYGKEKGHGVRYYMDYEMLYENEEETGPTFAFELDTTKFGNGRHMFSVSACDHCGHVGTHSVVIDIENHPAPPVGPDYSVNEEDACCGNQNVTVTDETPPNEDDKDGPKDCGSLIGITSGTLSQDHMIGATAGGLGPTLGIALSYQSSFDTVMTPLQVRISGLENGAPTVFFRFKIAGRTMSGRAGAVGGGVFVAAAAWDTKDENGALVPAGTHTYIYEIYALDSVGNTAYMRSGVGTVNVKRSVGALFARRWTSSLESRLVENEDGVVTWIDPHGQYYAFTPNLDGSYSPPAGSFTTLTLRSTGFEVRTKDGTIHKFGADLALVSVTDRFENALTYHRSNGVVTVVTDAVGRSINVSYGPSGKVSSMLSPDGSATSFDYDEEGNLTRVTEPGGAITTYVYDANALMTSKTCPLGATTTYLFNEYEKVISKTDPLENVTTYQRPTETYSFFGSAVNVNSDENPGTIPVPLPIVTVIRPKGNKEIYDFNKYWASTKEIDGAGNAKYFSYTADRKLSQFKWDDETTYETFINYAYDTLGNLSLIQKRYAPTNTYFETYMTYDPTYSQPLSITDANGNTSHFVYNSKGSLARSIDPTRATTIYRHNERGQLTSVKNALGKVTSFTYDDHGNVVTVTGPLGITMSFTYDVMGRMLTWTDPKGNVTTFTYDTAGKLVTSTDALGNVTTFDYDASGNPTRLTDANGNAYRTSYAACSLPIEAVDPLGYITSQSYDANTNLASRTDARGLTTSFEYDGADRHIRRTYPDLSTIELSYDKINNLKTVRGARSDTDLSYDVLNRLVGVSYLSLGRSLAYEYDRADKLVKMSTSDSKVTSYAYDKAGRLITLIDPFGGKTTFEYDLLGRRIKRTAANRTTTQYLYDDASRLTGLIHKDPAGATLLAYSYTYDPSGNRTSVTDLNGAATSYTYDALDRLTTVTHPDSTTESYTYDSVGNRLTRTNSDEGTIACTYDEANRLLSAGADSFRYDENGNTTLMIRSGERLKLTWDYEDKLTRATFPSGESVDYDYDGSGRRVSRTNLNGETERYLYDGDDIIEVLRDSETVHIVHGPGTDEPLRIYSKAGRGFYHADGLGTVTGITGPNGNLAQSYQYDAWGNITGTSGVTDATLQPYTFTGREIDPDTGLYYYRARYYDPATGRFLSKDPIGFNGGDTNLYGYVGNNPVNFVDPSGLFDWEAPDKPTPMGSLPSFSPECSEPFVDRVWENFKYTNSVIPGTFGPTGLSVVGSALTGGGIAPFIRGGITPFELVTKLGGSIKDFIPNLRRIPTAAKVGFGNWLAFSIVFEAGLMIGSIIYTGFAGCKEKCE